MTYRLFSFLAYGLASLSDKNLNLCASGLSTLFYRVFRFRRRLIRKNIRIALGENVPAAAVDKIGFESTKSLILTALELIESRYRNIAEHVTVKNSAILEDVLKKGDGCFILCTHLANWEALAGKICQTYAPAYVPVKAVGGRQINRFLTDIRTKYGLYTKERLKKGDSYEIIKSTIGAGHIVGFMQDQSRPGSPKLTFFGRPAKTNISMPAIWRKTPASVVPVLARRISARHHEIEFFPPLDMTRDNDADRDNLTNAQTMNAMVEKIILANPNQYLWMHDRWKE